MQPASGPEPDPTQPNPVTPGGTTPPSDPITPTPSEATAPTPPAASPTIITPSSETPSSPTPPETAPTPPASTPGPLTSPAATTTVPTPTEPAVVAAAAPSSPAPEEALASVDTPIGAPVVVATEADVPPPPSPRRKIILFSAIGGALLILLTAGVVFGLYLPNTPSSVWNSGLNRTGKALEQIVTTASDPKKLEAYKSSEISGTADITVDKQQYNGTFSSNFDQSNSDSGLEITTKDSTGKTAKLNAKVLTTLAPKSSYPDIYLQVTGLKAFGLDSFIPSLTAYEGRWIMIDSAYLESIGASYLSATDGENQKQVTSSDIAAAAQSAVSVTNEYVFTTDDKKAVFIQDSFVGKEEVDGIKTYHYKVSIDPDHATAYCEALSNAMLSTEAYKKLSGATDKEITESKKQVSTECKDSVKKDIKASETFDLWIDKSRKLVYKVRVTDTENKSSYTEIGQKYTGGDTLGLFVSYHDAEAKSDSKFTLETDLKTNATSGSYVAKGTDSDYPYDVNVTVKAKPSTESVKVTKPSPVTSIQEIINKINSLFSY